MSDLNYENVFEIAQKYGCEVLKNEPLKNHITFNVGGPCLAVIVINSFECCKEIFLACKNEKIPFFVIGKGSNLLVPDEGFCGIVFKISEGLSSISVEDETIINCQAGASLGKVSEFALENSLTGLEFAYGIPGNIGGAVFMNAGAYGGEICDVILSATVLDPDGEIRTYTKDEMDLSYRHSIFMDKGSVILSARISLIKGDKEQINDKMNELMQKRRDKQPLEFHSAGSTFKRPEGSYASMLIEQCGLKGCNVGDAEVSTKHSGFLINKGNATYRDITELIKIVQKEVFEKTGYKLEPEVKIVKCD